jgi:hypothetical protein
MGWEGHVARFVFEGNCIHGLGEKPEGHRNDLEDTGVHERVITKWILKKSVGRAWIGFLWFRIGIGGGVLQKQ